MAILVCMKIKVFFYALGFEINTITRILKPHCMLIYTCMFAGLFIYNWGGGDFIVDGQTNPLAIR